MDERDLRVVRTVGASLAKGKREVRSVVVVLVEEAVVDEVLGAGSMCVRTMRLM